MRAEAAKSDCLARLGAIENQRLIQNLSLQKTATDLLAVGANPPLLECVRLRLVQRINSRFFWDCCHQ
jgi:hypothetical protein